MCHHTWLFECGFGGSNLGLLTSVVSTFLSQPSLQPLLNSESDLDISS